MSFNLKLRSYWRSSASYRVRIALNLKGLKYETLAVDLANNEQHETGIEELQAQHMVPVLVYGERVMRQSLAIIEWLEEHFEGRGFPLLSHPPRERVRIRSLSNMIACDVAPISVLRVLQYLAANHGFDDAFKRVWTQHWIKEGFDAFESLLDNPSTGGFCEGDEPTMADCCLIPQVYNAKRWQLDMQPYPRIMAIYDRAMEMPEFDEARPEKQPDAPSSQVVSQG